MPKLKQWPRVVIARELNRGELHLGPETAAVDPPRKPPTKALHSRAQNENAAETPLSQGLSAAF